MSDLITMMWEGLRDSGIPEVMLYLPDGSASRCHWNDTAIVGDIRVALLGDQDRNIVRILPIASCVGIGVPSPKGVDPLTHRGFVKDKLAERASGESEAASSDTATEASPDASTASDSSRTNQTEADKLAASRQAEPPKVASTHLVVDHKTTSSLQMEAKTPVGVAAKPTTVSSLTASKLPPASSYQ